METRGTDHSAKVTSNADRLNVEHNSANLSSKLTHTEPVSKPKKRRKKKPATQWETAETSKALSYQEVPRSINPDGSQQQSKYLRESFDDGSNPPLMPAQTYGSSGRSLSQKLVSTNHSGKASSYLYSTSGGKASERLTFTESSDNSSAGLSAGLQRTGSQNAAGRIRIIGTSSMSSGLLKKEGSFPSELAEHRPIRSSRPLNSVKHYKVQNIRATGKAALNPVPPIPSLQLEQSIGTTSLTDAAMQMRLSRTSAQKRMIQQRLRNQQRGQQLNFTGNSSSTPMLLQIPSQSGETGSFENSGQGAVSLSNRPSQWQRYLRKNQAGLNSMDDAGYSGSLFQKSLAAQVLSADLQQGEVHREQQRQPFHRSWLRKYRRLNQPGNGSGGTSSGTSQTAANRPDAANASPPGKQTWRKGAGTAAAVVVRSISGAEQNLIRTAQENDETARQTDQFRQITARNARMICKTTENGAQLGRSGWKLTRKAAQKAQKAGFTAAKAAVTETLKRVIQMITVAVTSTLGTILAPLAIIALILVILTTLITGVIIPTVSPYGIFLVQEQEQELEFSTAVQRITSSYYDQIYNLQLEDDYDEIEVICGITDSDQTWMQIVAVYAVNSMKQGYDSITMDNDHYQMLKDVFWSTITISHSTDVTYETVVEVVQEEQTTTVTHYYDPDGHEVMYPVSGGSARTETITTPAVTRTTIVAHKKLSVSIQVTDLVTVETHYSFDDGEKAAVDELLSEDEAVWSAISDCFTNLIISSGGSGGAIDVTEYTTAAETVYRALIAEGYSMQAACGILGNIQQESHFNPNAVNRYSGAYGLCQWLGGRLTSLKSRNDYASVAAQTAFMISELRSQTSIWSTYGGQISHTYDGVRITSLNAFKSCTNPKAAAGAFCVCFERPGEFPGDEGYENRVNNAQAWYSYAQSHWTDSTSDAA